MLRLTKTVCFAEEMTRLVLTKSGLYTELGLNKVWDGVDYKVKSDDRVVSLRIHVRGFSRVVYSTCLILLGREGRLDEGQCRIELKGNDSHDDAYWCMCVNDEMRYYGASHVITERAFGLEEDLAADLQSAGIRTRLELQMLSESEICSIFRPWPETDPYVLTHPDPGAYAERQMLDKLGRLQPALEAMGIELQGPRITQAEVSRLV